MADEAETTQKKWDAVYREADDVPAMAVVTENLHLLPSHGKGLELACGLAANSFLLAEQGLEMDAWDISPVAAERVNKLAAKKKLNVYAIARDVVVQPPDRNEYDVIVVTHFLDRSIVPAIIAALKPGGLLFYQTFTQTKVSEGGPGKDEWRLADGELLSLFSELQPLVYREEGRVGKLEKGFRNEAMLVAQKR